MIRDVSETGGQSFPPDPSDEAFIPAESLRAHMLEVQRARAEQASAAADRAEKARQQLIKELSKPVTPDELHDTVQSIQSRLRAAAERGETELMVLRFPVGLCSDRGRAINNGDADWPTTLTGRPRLAYEFWRDKLRPVGYRLSASIVDWPDGLPGEVGFFLGWGNETQ